MQDNDHATRIPEFQSCISELSYVCDASKQTLRLKANMPPMQGFLPRSRKRISILT